MFANGFEVVQTLLKQRRRPAGQMKESPMQTSARTWPHLFAVGDQPIWVDFSRGENKY
jgi:hypothetical protein